MDHMDHAGPSGSRFTIERGEDAGRLSLSSFYRLGFRTRRHLQSNKRVTQDYLVTLNLQYEPLERQPRHFEGLPSRDAETSSTDACTSVVTHSYVWLHESNCIPGRYAAWSCLLTCIMGPRPGREASTSCCVQRYQGWIQLLPGPQQRVYMGDC